MAYLTSIRDESMAAPLVSSLILSKNHYILAASISSHLSKDLSECTTREGLATAHIEVSVPEGALVSRCCYSKILLTRITHGTNYLHLGPKL